jgi:hypothetical protein
MSNGVFQISNSEEYRRAGSLDLIEMLPVPDCNPLFMPKLVLETIVGAVTRREFIHVSGPSGVAKTALIEALSGNPSNFLALCSYLGAEPKPLRLFPIETPIYETAGELWQHRSIKNNQTYDEFSGLVQALIVASKIQDAYPLIWLREMGRVMSSSVQGGLLNLMASNILLPNGERIDGRNIAWIADSNYQAEREYSHSLVPFDDALKRRFTVNITLGYLTPKQEAYALAHLMQKRYGKSMVNQELIKQVVKLGMEIRSYRMEGMLKSVPPPTIYGYEAFLRMAMAMPHLSAQQVANMTLLGAAWREDEKHISAILGKIFGVQGDSAQDSAMAGNVI